MKKAILLFLSVAISGNALSQPIRTLLWETVGLSEDKLSTTRIERFPAGEGWLVKIITLKNGTHISYMFVPDKTHSWTLYSEEYQKAFIDGLKT
ncbi:hypothetical protein KW791_00160 [Candidatus Parcubacteria bacterium]|nr:hypothetical protein [Candidatus Parcubacteria bacterium]